MSKDAQAPHPSERAAHRFVRRREIVRAVNTGLIAVILGSLIIGLALGRPALQAKAAQSRRVPISVSFNWPTTPSAAQRAKPKPDERGETLTSWLSVPYRRHLEALARTTLTEDPFDRNALEATRLRLLETGWFERIFSVRREANGLVRIEADWRVPAALVRYRDRDRLVSSKGELLEPAFKAGEADGFKVIVNPSKPPPRIGEAWLGGDVQGALALLGSLRPYPFFDQVASIDASAYASKKQLVIITTSGSRLIWGGAPSDTTLGEASAATKLAHLAAIYKQFNKRLDAGKSTLDVRFDRVLVDNSAAALAAGSGQPKDDAASTAGATGRKP
ncbi:MAG: cell division protein FtsQ [Phycisphaerae bacterium]|nr:cell division protein FtsQ [Phycisphaerae bacterium]